MSIFFLSNKDRIVNGFGAYLCYRKLHKIPFNPAGI